LEKETNMPYITSVERIGIEKGIEKGIERARRETLLDVLEARFGELPADLVQRVAAISVLEELRKLNVLAATAGTLEEFQDGV
jgi:hypothetical protein